MTVRGRAKAIADSYVGCTLAQGRELTGVLAALEGSPELEQVKRTAERAYFERCREILRPFTDADGMSTPSLTAVFGAADALSHGAVSGSLTPTEAIGELTDLIVAAVDRS
jgi:hypothetical protein